MPEITEKDQDLWSKVPTPRLKNLLRRDEERFNIVEKERDRLRSRIQLSTAELQKRGESA